MGWSDAYDKDSKREFSEVFSDGLMGSEYDDVDRRK